MERIIVDLQTGIRTTVTISPEEEAAIIAAGIQTAQQQRDAISSAIQQMLDDKAKSLRYDSILSARSYAGYANPFQAEALKLADWAASCWDTAGNIEYQVISGAIPMPSVQQALAMMPLYV